MFIFDKKNEKKKEEETFTQFALHCYLDSHQIEMKDFNLIWFNIRRISLHRNQKFKKIKTQKKKKQTDTIFRKIITSCCVTRRSLQQDFFFSWPLLLISSNNFKNWFVFIFCFFGCQMFLSIQSKTIKYTKNNSRWDRWIYPNNNNFVH